MFLRSRPQKRTSRRRSILGNLQNMDTIIEESVNEVNWNSYVDPRAEEKFDRKVEQRYKPQWALEQDIFDDELLKSMFHWNPDHYNKLPNKNRKNRNRNNSNCGSSSRSSFSYGQYDSFNSCDNFSNCDSYQNYFDYGYEFDVTITHFDNQVQNNVIPDSIKQFGPPPGLSKPVQSNNYNNNNNNFTDSASLENTKIKSDEELLKDRSAIFATDFSSDSNFSDNYVSDNDLDSTDAASTTTGLSGFKLNPTAQVFQPRFT
jgi:hypothetical protein